jgi:cell division protein FtsI (penicillin-binding protein 3)
MQKPQQSIPNVQGCQEWMRLLYYWNLGVKVKAVGMGKVRTQSILQAGQE